jgi:regulatory protein
LVWGTAQVDGRITALKLQRRNTGRVNIYVDGAFAFALRKSVASRLRLGEAVDDQRIAELKALEAEEQAYQRALRWLARRARSEHEVRRRLLERGCQEASAARVIERLKQVGLLDDQAFARAWIEDRMAFRPRSAFALRRELEAKGLPAQVIQEALKRLDEDAALEAAAARAARRYRHLSQDLFRQRMTAYLQRRGFQFHAISSVIDRLQAALAESEDESEVVR